MQKCKQTADIGIKNVNKKLMLIQKRKQTADFSTKSKQTADNGVINVNKQLTID